jgi:hypothetical protein
MKHELHFEHGDLTGEVSLTLGEGQTLNELFGRYILGFNADRLEAYAIRVLLGKENVLTLYAVDTYRQESSSIDPERIPVKKYKVPDVPLKELIDFFGEINLTVSTKNYPLELLQVINK